MLAEGLVRGSEERETETDHPFSGESPHEDRLLEEDGVGFGDSNRLGQWRVVDCVFVCILHDGDETVLTAPSASKRGQDDVVVQQHS